MKAIQMRTSKAFLKLIFYWNIVDLQCCANFFCIAKWFSYTYINILLYISFPLWFITGCLIYWYFPVLFSRTLLFSILYILVCICYFSTKLPLALLHPTLATTNQFSMSVSLFVLYLRFHIWRYHMVFVFLFLIYFS